MKESFYGEKISYYLKGIYGGRVFQAKDKLDYFCIFTSSSNFSAFSGVARNK